MGESKVKATWEGSALVVTTTRAGRDGNMMTTKAVYTLEGGNLVVATTRPGRDGGEMTTKVFYKKAR